MKELKDYNVTPERLAEVVAAYNASDKAAVKIVTDGYTPEETLVAFLAAVHAVSTDNNALLPDVVKAFYNTELPEQVFDDVTTEMEAAALLKLREAAGTAGEETGSEQVDEVTSDCPTFGSQNAAEPDCQDCKTDHPDEYAACAAKTAAAATSEKGKKKTGGKKTKTPKEKKVKAPKTPKEKKVKEPKPPKEKVITKRTRYGHAVGTMSGDIDNAVFQGGHIDSITAFIAKKHNRDLSAAKAKIRGHVNHLIQNKGITVTEVEGILKATVEYAKDRNAENTLVEVLDLPAYTPPAETTTTEVGAAATEEKAAE